MKTSRRKEQWDNFSPMVGDHIDSYTVQQYGDMPNDQASGFTPEEVASHIKRYCNRVGKNARGIEEQKRDCLKMAHYACILYYKITGEEK